MFFGICFSLYYKQRLNIFNVSIDLLSTCKVIIDKRFFQAKKPKTAKMNLAGRLILCQPKMYLKKAKTKN